MEPVLPPAASASSWTGFEHQVEQRLGGPPESCEPIRGHHVSQGVSPPPGRRGRGRLAAGSSPDDALRRLGLTEREAQVLGLLTEGRTNRQIGDALFISEKTASVHVTNLLRKLGVGSRAEAAEMSRRLR
jgi:DNA-binding CsgD family transcriptional regulator